VRSHEEQHQQPASLPLGANHQLGVSATLALMDEMLCRIEEWAGGRERKGVLYQERNNLRPAQRRALAQECARLRMRLESSRRELGLTVTCEEAATDVWSRCAALRETIMQLEGRHLRRYGAVAPEVEAYMDALSRDLLAGLDRLLQALAAQDGHP
jgi:hypothetical protein